ncbi:hypothetical protein GCM10009688_17210 [Arthrobacter gandavensis]|uniref:Uncharacterized protein n=1 Tax=Arthrobacter gandavensis TaxID=169960 RepID=A0ABP5AIP3_9MICC
MARWDLMNRILVHRALKEGLERLRLAVNEGLECLRLPVNEGLERLDIMRQVLIRLAGTNLRKHDGRNCKGYKRDEGCA